MLASQPLFSCTVYARNLCLLSCLCLLGCSDSAPVATAPKSVKPAPTGPAGDKLLEQMRVAYRKADSYADNAAVVFYAVSRVTGGEIETPYTRTAVAFERPNKLSVTYQRTVSATEQDEYKIVSNGKYVRCAAEELTDQVQEAVSPGKLSVENFIPEAVLRAAILRNAIENTLPQLALLFADGQDETIFPGEESSRVLDAEELDGKPYHRVEIESPVGKRILWIDQDNYSLRRMEIPIDNQRQEINARNEYSKVAVWIDFENVSLDPDIDDDTFEFAVPDGVRRVRRFIPPPPAGPPEFLGKPIGEFAFQTLEGDSVTPATQKGKVTVLDFWSTNCPPCKAQTPVLNQVYEQFKDNDEVAFMAVSIDSRVVPNDVVAKTMASWGGEMPVVRDLNSSGYGELGVRQTPTLILADRDGQLQIFQTGAHRSPDPLISTIQRLVDGEDLVATDRQKAAEYAVKYQEALDAATIETSLVHEATDPPAVPSRQLPTKLQLTKLWQTSADDVRNAGDVLVLPEDQGADRLFVLDGGQAIVELDASGKLLARHELPEAEQQPNGFLRTWANSKGDRWYLVSGVGWQKVSVFDQNWQQVMSFPDEQHSGIGDVLFDDLSNSDTPVMHVGYWGGRGLQGGTLDGRQLWTNRRQDHVLQVGLGPEMTDGTRTAWCTGTRGTLYQLGTDGKPRAERYISGKALMYFASHWETEDHCGISVDKLGSYSAVGFDSANAVIWEYPLPAGNYVAQLPRILSVRLPDGENGWMIVAANGSLHWLDIEGELFDTFDYGEILTGVAMHSSDDRTVLFCSTADNLTAWQLKLPETVTVEDAESAEDPLDAETESADSEEPAEPDAATQSED